MNPPYQLTDEIVAAVAEVMRQVGRLEALHGLSKQSLALRRQNRVRSIYSTLAIEGNSLSLEQVSAIMDEQRVLGTPKDVLEVTNALQVYDRLSDYDWSAIDDFLAAHGQLLAGLTVDAGRFRSRGVGIQKGGQVTHVAPPAANVRGLMRELFKYVRNGADHMLIKSAVCHYEIEFIHPFSDGNGRMGRLWQTRLLMEISTVFEYLPVESLIKDRQQRFYTVLESCDSTGQSTEFVAFMLDVLIDALTELAATDSLQSMTANDRLAHAGLAFENNPFSRKDYLIVHPTISTATASRDLKIGCDTGILTPSGTGRMTRYRFQP